MNKPAVTKQGVKVSAVSDFFSQNRVKNSYLYRSTRENVGKMVSVRFYWGRYALFWACFQEMSPKTVYRFTLPRIHPARKARFGTLIAVWSKAPSYSMPFMRGISGEKPGFQGWGGQHTAFLPSKPPVPVTRNPVVERVAEEGRYQHQRIQQRPTFA